ncbi:triose-phosphate isomerase [Salana multivorans]
MVVACVWAIGTGEGSRRTTRRRWSRPGVPRATVDADVAAGLRILYGGSVKGDNVKEIMAGADRPTALWSAARAKVASSPRSRASALCSASVRSRWGGVRRVRRTPPHQLRVGPP